MRVARFLLLQVRLPYECNSEPGRSQPKGGHAAASSCSTRNTGRVKPGDKPRPGLSDSATPRDPGQELPSTRYKNTMLEQELPSLGQTGGT